MLELCDKGFKAAIIKMALTHNDKHTSNKRKHTKISAKKIQIRKHQMEFFELKNAITEITVWMSSIAEWEDREDQQAGKKNNKNYPI